MTLPQDAQQHTPERTVRVPATNNDGVRVFWRVGGRLYCHPDNWDDFKARMSDVKERVSADRRRTHG